MIYAINQDGKKVHILNAWKEERYSCEHCDDQVIPMLGMTKPRYFRHTTRKDCIGIRQHVRIGCIQFLNMQQGKCLSVNECQEECKFK